MSGWRVELRRRAENALSKVPPYGVDVDFSEFITSVPATVEERRIEELPGGVVERARELGVDVSEERVGGTYFQLDYSVVRTYVVEKLRRYGVVVTSIEDALKKFGWVRDYYWRAVPVDLDKYTAATELYGKHGYFIYVPPGVKVKEPIQACLFIHRESVAQLVHNVIIVDEGAELNLVTACASLPTKALHVGVSEFYVRKNAKLTFTMVHFWGHETHVRPREAAIVEDGGFFVSYYVSMAPVRSLQMYPTVYLVGRDAQAYLTTILLAGRTSQLDVGGCIVFSGDDTRGEVVSRSVIRDEAYVVMRGELVGERRCKGHLDCKGLILSTRARGEAIPMLRTCTELAELTHEAALGRISRDELEYLMSKGFTEEEATSMLVRGFLEVGLDKIPSPVREYVANVLEVIAKYAKG